MPPRRDSESDIASLAQLRLTAGKAPRFDACSDFADQSRSRTGGSLASLRRRVLFERPNKLRRNTVELNHFALPAWIFGTDDAHHLGSRGPRHDFLQGRLLCYA